MGGRVGWEGRQGKREREEREKMFREEGVKRAWRMEGSRGGDDR